MRKNELIYLSYAQAIDLVDRIAERTENFNHIMAVEEKNAMANLLSDIGVTVDDLLDVSNLADNYAINAEIVTPEDYKNYDMKEVKQDYLFSWKDADGKNHYCLTW
jgi:hypothetical protein